LPKKIKDIVIKEAEEFKGEAEGIIKESAYQVKKEIKLEAAESMGDIKAAIIHEVIEIVVPFLISNAEGVFRKAGKAVLSFIGKNIGRLKFW